MYAIWIAWGIVAFLCQLTYIAAAPDIGGKIPIKLWSIPLAIMHILLCLAGIYFLFIWIGYLIWGDPYLAFVIPETASN